MSEETMASRQAVQDASGKAAQTVPYPVGPDVAKTYALVRHAIQKREQLLGFHEGHWVTVCPHVLGWRAGEPVALCYELFGAPQAVREPLGSPRLWRWIRLADFRAVTTRTGFWFSTPRQLRPALDELEVEIEVA